MLIDDKGRFFRKISFIDVFVLIVVTAVFMVAYLKFGGSGKTAVRTKEVPVRITFYKPALEDFTVNSIIEETAINESKHEGQTPPVIPVVNDSNGTFMGNVVSVRHSPFDRTFMPDDNGINQQANMEGYSAVWIETEVTGRMSDGTVLLNGNLYGVGSQVIIWIGKSKVQAIISYVGYSASTLDGGLTWEDMGMKAPEGWED